VRKSAQWIIGLAISVLAFALAFRSANPAQVGQSLREANYIFMLPAVGLICAGLFLRAASWRVILGGQIPYWRVFDAMNEGYLLNNLLPFRLGELGRAYLVSRGHGLKVTHVLSSVVVERLIDLLMVIVMLAAFLPLIVGLAWARSAAVASAIIGVGALTGLVVLARNRLRVLRLARWGLSRAAWLSADKWEGRTRAFLDGLGALQDTRRSLEVAFWSGGAWATAGLGAWLLLRAFVASATPAMGFFAITILGLGLTVPSAPGAVGVFEAAVVAALSVYGVDNSLALSFALVFHVTYFALTTTLGGLALSREGETLSHLARSAQSLLR